MDEIFQIEEPSTLAEELGYFILYKFSIARQKLTPAEDLFLKLHHMLAEIWGQGFFDLFYQQYSLSDCVRVEQALREMGLRTLADLFVEAKAIYLRHMPDPFSLGNAGPDGDRFDEIAKQFTAAGSEIFQLPLHLGPYARQHQHEFRPIA
ncbi:hypothetical protein FEM03_18280 [Phragmitibacter flavus]|uniref:DNA mimic protein DMP19 C-terminal domain-containing protein n=1 Tax=Phragmitibacter flavus TaxID=2576071 RepID=A0A5R8KCL0_9BACT|nr:hypothetical protein [Phragmitibacter flavus]TLD69319.1 hypothetical protein FEM03_18280 [Phragmitibacter flavus]